MGWPILHHVDPRSHWPLWPLGCCLHERPLVSLLHHSKTFSLFFRCSSCYHRRRKNNNQLWQECFLFSCILKITLDVGERHFDTSKDAASAQSSTTHWPLCPWTFKHVSYDAKVFKYPPKIHFQVLHDIRTQDEAFQIIIRLHQWTESWKFLVWNHDHPKDSRLGKFKNLKRKKVNTSCSMGLASDHWKQSNCLW